MKLQNLWENTMNEGYDIRIRNLNGLERWQIFKKEYTNYHLESGPVELKPSFIELCKTMNYIEDPNNEKDDTITLNGRKLKNQGDNHFFVQIFRIPTKENFKLSVLKFMQIAYNIGQVKALIKLDGRLIDDDVINFYDEHRLGHIETYIFVLDQDVQAGGDYEYKYKYKKYKKKYLMLKFLFQKSSV